MHTTRLAHNLCACLALWSNLPAAAVAQNLDLVPIAVFGRHRALGGAGIAAPEAVFGVVLNPASLVGVDRPTVAGATSVRHHAYSRVNERHARDLKADFELAKNDFDLGLAMAAFRLPGDVPLAVGITQRLNPFLFNQRRAFTWSNLFDQKTDGGLHAVTLGAALAPHRRLDLGATLFINRGTVTSSIKGDNHGNDAGKSAQLESRLSGVNAKLGATARVAGHWRAGLTFELPYDLNVEARASVSSDSLYAPLLPDYEETTWRMPWSLGVGAAFETSAWLVAFDYTTHQFTATDAQLVLFEFGGTPNWKEVHSVRAGFEYQAPGPRTIPVRLGYAYVPQVYASNTAEGSANTVTRSVDTVQNARHLITTGTRATVGGLALDLSFEYGRLGWRRDLTLPGEFIQDDYRETTYALAVDLTYAFR